MNFFDLFTTPPIGSLTVQGNLLLTPLLEWIETSTNHQLGRVAVSKAVIDAVQTQEVTLSFLDDRLSLKLGEMNYEVFAGYDDKTKTLYIVPNDIGLCEYPAINSLPDNDRNFTDTSMPGKHFDHLTLFSFIRSFAAGALSTVAQRLDINVNEMLTKHVPLAFIGSDIKAAQRLKLSLSEEALVCVKDDLTLPLVLTRWSLISNTGTKLSGSVISG